MIYIGTSGYSYQDWVGPFYPRGMKKSEFLTYYSRFFSACELNYTYYTIPYPRTMEAIIRKSYGKVRFSVKAHSSMTHESATEEGDENFKQFIEGVRPLVDAGLFACILAQFPWSFRPSSHSIDILKTLRDRFHNLPVVFEFRNDLWVRDDEMREKTLSLLRDIEAGFCCVDEPEIKGLMPRISAAASDIGYIRFHGRNSEKWWKSEKGYERYDYLYTEDELKKWVPKIDEVAQKTSVTYVFFNNHFQGQAIKNAMMLAHLLYQGAKFR